AGWPVGACCRATRSWSGWSSATSARGDDATTCAGETWPSANWMAARAADCTACGAVMLCPSVLISTPEPRPGIVVIPAAGTGDRPRSSVRTSTTDGLTLRNSADTCCAGAETGTDAAAAATTTHATDLTDPPVATGILTGWDDRGNKTKVQ